MIVFKHIETLSRTEAAKEQQEIFSTLSKELHLLVDQVKVGIPLLGLNEIRMWVKSKQTCSSLRAIFLQEVKQNLEELKQTVLS